MSLSDQLAIIITSSAIPSNPSTIVLETVLKGFEFVPDLISCNIVVVFDGYLESVRDVSQYKRMRLCQADADHYAQYRCKAIDLLLGSLGIGCSTQPKIANYISKIGAYRSAVVQSSVYAQDGRPLLHVLIPSTRLGFALTIREALNFVTTPYILIQQHDWVFMHEMEFKPILAAMNAQPEKLKYVGFFSRQAMKRLNRSKLPRTVSCVIEGLCLAPLYFWYDKPHIAASSHYRQFVFGRQRFQVGDFIEDTMGHVMMKDIRDSGPGKHLEYGTWVLVCDESGKQPTLRHVNGRKYSETAYMRCRKPKRNPQAT